jgi:hypothetical protein
MIYTTIASRRRKTSKISGALSSNSTFAMLSPLELQEGSALAGMKLANGLGNAVTHTDMYANWPDLIPTTWRIVQQL